MIKITGFEELGRELEDAQKALAELEGDLGSVNFTPDDPESIEAAIQSMEQIIDERVGRYANNSIIGPLAEETKANFRQAILDQAAAARLEGDAD